ncbi:MAG TPA: glycerol-3-phosphate dehydrogenase, partial [Spirochaetia bacterium]|nr:glycerol-3-phosphate dehydrogenase [Spirochaetia bacterium]
MRIAILGAGAMGSSFSFPPADNGNEVCLVGTHLDDSLISEARGTGVHPRAGIPFPGNVEVYPLSEFANVMKTTPDLVVLGVSSAGIAWAVRQLTATLRKPVPVLLLTKGLAAEGARLRALTDTVAEALSDFFGRKCIVAGVAGPCIATELAARRPTSVVIAGSSDDTLVAIQSAIETGYYRVSVTRDATGIEACAAYKNFYALAVGAAAGWNETRPIPVNRAGMNNATASMFARALQEMEYLVGKMGGKAETVYGLAGSGDLYVTCQAGRNSRMGRLLGTGLSYSEAKAAHMPEDTIEGAELAGVIG